VPSIVAKPYPSAIVVEVGIVKKQDVGRPAFKLNFDLILWTSLNLIVKELHAASTPFLVGCVSGRS
jgi:hypothetical protein